MDYKTQADSKFMRNLVRTVAGILFAVSLCAAGLYFTNWSRDHARLTAATMLCSLLLSVLLGLWWLLTKPAPVRYRGEYDAHVSIDVSGSNTGQQIGTNTGTVHIGDNVHHLAIPQTQPARDYRAEWLNLASSTKANCQFFRADWSMNNILGESWDVKAGGDRFRCEAWLRQAGAMLLASPRVRSQLPQSVLDDPDNLHRWLRYLKERYIFEQKHYLTTTCDDGRIEKISMGSIPDLARQSETACVDCSTLEL